MDNKTRAKAFWDAANKPNITETEQISILGSLIELRPTHARALAKLALLYDNAGASTCNANKNSDGDKSEAMDFCRRSITSAPEGALFPYIALSTVSKCHAERMEALHKSLDLLEVDHKQNCEQNTTANDSKHGQIAIVLVRLMIEPRDEQRRKWREQKKKKTQNHALGSDPMRKQLTNDEEGRYLRVNSHLSTIWEIFCKQQKEGSVGASTDAIHYRSILLVEYRLGVFFRRLDFVRSKVHFGRVLKWLPESDNLRKKAIFWYVTLMSDNYGDSNGDENRDNNDGVVVNQQDITRCPPEYVESLYSSFAANFDDLLVNKLGYQTPTLLRKTVDEFIPVERDLIRNAIDLGCGTGLSGISFCDLVSNNFVGVDLSPEMVEKATLRNCYNNVVVEDVETYLEGITCGSVHLILACDVFVYLGDLEKVFFGAKNALASNGFFTFSTEALLSNSERDYFLHDCARFAHNTKYVERLAREYGFCICKIHQVPIRKNKGKQVQGNLVVLRKEAMA